MSLARRSPCSVLASAMLVAVALAAAPEALHARNAKGSAAQDWERRSAQAESAGHARAELDRRMDQSRSHPQSSDTMYASTPDPAPPPHPAHAGANTKSAPGRSGPPSGMPARSGAAQAHRIGLFPSAGDTLGREGFARIVNHSASDGEVRIDAYDDEGISVTRSANRSTDALHVPVHRAFAGEGHGAHQLILIPPSTWRRAGFFVF